MPNIKNIIIGTWMVITMVTMLGFSSSGKEIPPAQLVFFRIQRDLNQDWLKAQLLTRGFQPSDYKIEKSEWFPGEMEVRSSKVELIQLVNRMRAFLGGVPNRAYVLLTLVDKTGNGKELRCITKDWTPFKADLKWNEEKITVENLAAPKIQACKVKGEGKFSHLYKNLSSPMIRKTFFDQIGQLKIDQYPQLDKDLEFIYFLISRGFFPEMGDFSGHLALN